MKTSNVIKGIVFGAIVLVIWIGIAYSTMTRPSLTTTTTPAPMTTPTTEATLTATPTPVEGRPEPIPTTINLPAPGQWTPVDKAWEEASIELWGTGDVSEKKFSQMDSGVYKDKNDVYFTLYHFRVYVYEGSWTRTELFPMFGSKIVIGEGRKVLVLGEEDVEVWTFDYSQDNGYWSVSKDFAVTTDHSVFGDWVFPDTSSIAYIASDDKIYGISTRGITYRKFENVLCSDEYISVVSGATLLRVAYRSDSAIFTSVNEQILPTYEEEQAIFIAGDDIFDVFKATTQFTEEKGKITLDYGDLKVIID